MITFKINGISYKNILDGSFIESMTEFTNEAAFTIALDGKEESPFIIDSKCDVYIDDKKVMTGFIFDVQLSYDSGSHSLTYVVRDITADFSDSDIDKISELSGSLSLTRIIEIVAKSIGTKVKVKNDFDGLEDFNLEIDSINPDFPDSAFDYVESLARKRQVLLSTNSEGEITISRNSGEIVEGKIQNTIKNKESNNVISCSFSQNNSSRFNKYIVRSQSDTKEAKNPFAVKNKNKDSVNQVGSSLDNSVRVGRQKCLSAEQPTKNTTNDQRAIWQKEFSNATSSSYSVDLQGHSISGQIFRSNTLINVIDDFARISDNMLIKGVSFTYSLSDGSKTSLELVDKNSFRVIAQAEEKETLIEKNKNIFGGN